MNREQKTMDQEEPVSPFEPFRASLNRMSFMDILLWWERKRWMYNLIVGLCGSLGLVQIFLNKEHVSTLHLLEGILIYGLLANACYTGGWVCEALLRVLSGGKWDLGKTRKAFFYVGLVGSAALTLFFTVIFYALTVLD